MAVAAAPALAAMAAPSGAAPSVAACPNGESSDTFTRMCTPDWCPSPAFGATSPGGLPSIRRHPLQRRQFRPVHRVGGGTAGRGPDRRAAVPVSSSP